MVALMAMFLWLPNADSEQAEKLREKLLRAIL